MLVSCRVWTEQEKCRFWCTFSKDLANLISGSAANVRKSSTLRLTRVIFSSTTKDTGMVLLTGTINFLLPRGITLAFITRNKNGKT